jgi:signal transduction histidine kinase
MDGIEVCQRLQERSDTRSIPVIFVTARTTKESKLEGLAVGAVDYITKPIDLDETVARVQTQLRFAAINRENLELQRRLEESRRAATIGAVAQGIAHNLNNLLGVVIGYLDLIKAGYDKPPVVKKNAQNVDDAIQRIVGIIRQLSTLVVKSRPDLARVPLERLIDGGIRRFHNDYKLTAGVVVNNATPDLEIDTNIETFEEVLSKVLMNAWESYQDSPAEQRPISIYTRVFDKARGEKMLEIRVDDSGRGIAEEIRDRMFEPFVSTKRTVGVGMGLTIARHSLRSVGGEVTMSSRPEGGSSAVLVHPVRDPRRRDKSQDDEE